MMARGYAQPRTCPSDATNAKALRVPAQLINVVVVAVFYLENIQQCVKQCCVGVGRSQQHRTGAKVRFVIHLRAP